MSASGHVSPSLPAWLNPVRLARDLTLEECITDLREAVDVLQRQDGAGARRVGDALSAWLRDGGDLAKRLGVSVPRGKWGKLPSRLTPMQRRNDALRRLAATLPGSTPQQAEQLAALIANRDPRIEVIRSSVGVALPTSDRQLRRVIHGHEDASACPSEQACDHASHGDQSFTLPAR